MENRIGIVGIIVKNRSSSARQVNDILGMYGDIIKGRMGIPALKDNLCAIALIVEGDNDRIGAMTGKIGQIQNVKVSSTFIKKLE